MRQVFLACIPVHVALKIEPVGRHFTEYKPPAEDGRNQLNYHGGASCTRYICAATDSGHQAVYRIAWTR